MFNDKYGLTDAVLQGRKTMTRRILDYEKYKKTWDDMCRLGTPCFDTFDDFLIKRASRYKVGEVVAVAQSYQTILDTVFREDQQWKYGYMRDVEESHEKMWEDIKGRTNKMFVKADLMPYQIRITDIKVERMQDCSNDDILKEGIFQISAPIYRHYNGIGYTFKEWTDRGVECSSDTPKGAFKALIDKTCGRGTFESNPYVFAYSFKLLD